MKKGSQVYIEGKLRTRKYPDKDGVEKYSTEIVADTMQMLGSRQGMGGAGGGMDEGGSPAYAPRAAAPAAARQPMAPRPAPASRPAPAPAPTNSGFEDMDDDVPF